MDPALFIRGGGQVADVLSSSLKSGPTGVLTLWAIATSVVVPLTLYRSGWSFSIGYGFSVMTIGVTILKIFSMTAAPLSGAPLYLVTSVIFWGARLGLYLAFRNLSVNSKREQMKKVDVSPPLKRIPMAVSVALFYSFMVTPALYVARGASAAVTQKEYLQNISMAGAGIAWFGVIFEMLADAQKYVAKIGCDEKTFVGPTGGCFGVVRHPSYLAELMFWFGLFIGGAPSFGVTSIESIVPWVCSSVGLYGIYGIMKGATKRLEVKQKETYGGQEKYDLWRASVTSAIFPFIKDA